MIKSAVVVTCDVAGFSSMLKKNWEQAIYQVGLARTELSKTVNLFEYSSQVGDSFMGLRFVERPGLPYLMAAVQEVPQLQMKVKTYSGLDFCFGITHGDVYVENDDLSSQHGWNLGNVYAPAINRSFRLSEDVGSGTTILFETEYYKMDSPQY